MNTKIRRSTPDQTLGKLLRQFPNVEKTFEHIKVERADDDYPLRATYPVINSEAKSATLTAYDLYVAGYNKKVRSERSKIKKHNANLQLKLEKQPLKSYEQKQRHFESSYSHLTVWQYNEKAYNYNKKFGAIIPLQLPQTIKQASRHFFEGFLWSYSYQLFKLKKGKIEAKVKPYDRTVNPIEINTKHLENIKDASGNFIFNCHPESMLNHKNRFIEAGILIDNTFHSSKRGTQHHICPEILVVFDDFQSKFVFTDNQLFKLAQHENFRDVLHLTISINKPIVKRFVDKSTNQLRKKNEKANTLSDSQQESFSNADTHDLSDQTRANMPLATRAPRMKQKFQGGQKNTPEITPKKLVSAVNQEPSLNNENKHSAYLRSLLVLWHHFVQNLSEKKYENEKVLHFDILKYEALNGSLSRIDFRDVLITQIFKSFSKIYKNHERMPFIFAGEWKNALNSWLESGVFMNGNEVQCKTTALKHYQKILFAFTDAKFGAYRQAKRSGFIAPRPSVYLDPNLKTPGTFMHHYQSIAKNIPKVLAAEEKRKATKIQKEKANKQYTNNLKKLNYRIMQWHKSGQEFETLFKYVHNNMPEAIIKDFHKHLENFLLNLNKSKYNPFNAA